MAVNQKALAQRRARIHATERDVTRVDEFRAESPVLWTKHRDRIRQPAMPVRVRRIVPPKPLTLEQRRARAADRNYSALWQPYQRRA